LQLAADGQSLEWLTTDDIGEVILYSEPDTTLLLRLQNMLLSAFVPEQEL
jgi:putative cardiolipin synthase